MSSNDKMSSRLDAATVHWSRRFEASRFAEVPTSQGVAVPEFVHSFLDAAHVAASGAHTVRPVSAAKQYNDSVRLHSVLTLYSSFSSRFSAARALLQAFSVAAQVQNGGGLKPNPKHHAAGEVW